MMSCFSPLIRCCWVLLCAASLVAASTRRLDAFYSTAPGTASVPAAAFVPGGTSTSVLPKKTTAQGVAPPTGAIYQKTLPIPVIGRQSFRLHILSDQRAHLRIDGMLSVDEILDYRVKPCGAFTMLVPERLQKVLRRFRTQLVEFGYDQATDLPYVVVSPPLPTKIRIQLVREVPVTIYQDQPVVACSD